VTARTTDASAAVSDHHHAFFQGHDITDEKWTVGPADIRLPGRLLAEGGES
jgi:hypothetical protein